MNVEKHGNSFEEARRLFADPERIEVRPSYPDEPRLAVAGTLEESVGRKSSPIGRDERESSPYVAPTHLERGSMIKSFIRSEEMECVDQKENRLARQAQTVAQ